MSTRGSASGTIQAPTRRLLGLVLADVLSAGRAAVMGGAHRGLSGVASPGLGGRLLVGRRRSGATRGVGGLRGLRLVALDGPGRGPDVRAVPVQLLLAVDVRG